MAVEDKYPPEEHKFNIPAEEAPSDDALAVREDADFGKEWLLKSGKLEWGLKYVFKILLFAFVLGMNIWWSHRVLQLVWDSAGSKSGYRLSDSVLIALVTTSLANFIALVAIVAKHLFPSK